MLNLTLYLPEKFDSYLLCSENIISLKWCALLILTHSLSLQKNGLCSQHFPITPVSREITSKEEPKLKNYFSKAQHGKRRQRIKTRAGCTTLQDCLSSQTRKGDGIHTCTQWVQVKCSAQARIIHRGGVGAAVSTMLNCPCLYQVGRVGNLKISFRSSIVSFSQVLLSMGAKLPTGIPAQLLKHPHRKHFPESSYKSFSPTFFLNKEVRKQPSLPVNTAGGSTKGSSNFVYLLT